MSEHIYDIKGRVPNIAATCMTVTTKYMARNRAPADVHRDLASASVVMLSLSLMCVGPIGFDVTNSERPP